VLGSKVGLQFASFYSPYAKVSKFEPEKFNVRLRWRWIVQSLRQAHFGHAQCRQGSYKVGEPVEPLVYRLAIPFRGSKMFREVKKEETLRKRQLLRLGHGSL
jgi:hypothetical protein